VHFPGAVSLLHRATSLDVTVRLVNQVQVEIVELQATQGIVDRLACALVTSVLHPQFGRHEQLFAWNAGILDSLPNGRRACQNFCVWGIT
jgi:hypothetical protein